MGRILEVDRNRKVVRTIRVASYPWSARRLANGNTLIADYNQSRILEVDSKDKVVWQRTGIRYPRYAERLANGNTLVTHSQGVIEIRKDGKAVWNKVGSNMMQASRY